ncbi:MAG: aspartate dehydrogenase [Lachnospiraceae bacterium]|nr:aspartate dehydrogenase [Lachnospiraceae bacterium]
MLFGKKKQKQKPSFDKTGKYPVIRASICTGEKVAGFKSVSDGKFEELMLIRNDRDLREFLETYDVKAGELKKEW